MKTYRRMAVATMAASLCIGVSAPSALAAGGEEQAKAKSAQSAKTVNRRLNQTRRALNSVTTRTRRAEQRLATLDQAIAALRALSEGADGKASTLLGAAPQLAAGLTALRTALEKDVAPGLLTLKTVLEQDVGPGLTALRTALEKDVSPALKALQGGLTALTGNVTTLGTTVGTLGTNLGTLTSTVGTLSGRVTADKAEADATEYGVARVYRERAGTLTALGTVWSGDVPDDGNNAAVASGSTVDQACQAGDTFLVRAEMRTSETGEALAGQVGAGLVVTGGDGNLLRGAQTAANGDYGGVGVVDIADASPKTSGGPTDSGAGGVTAVQTAAIGAPAGGACVIQGTAQFFDFQDNPDGLGTD